MPVPPFRVLQCRFHNCMSAASALSPERLAANRANSQLSSGPKTEEGKAKSSLNAVKTGLCGRTMLLADEEEAAAYREHIARFVQHWQPVGLREHTLVQSLADTQWRLESIPGLESGVYARGRLRYAELYAEVEDATVRRVLLDAHVEDVDGKTLKNLRLHERRLTNRYEQDLKELNELQAERRVQEQQKEQESVAQPKSMTAAVGFEFTTAGLAYQPSRAREETDRSLTFPNP